jgi:hypothetical protein
MRLRAGLADVHRTTLTLTVVVRVVAVASLRPAAGERATAHLAAHETAQRKLGMIPLSRAGDNDAPVEHGLRTVERRLIHDRLKIALCRDAVVRALDLPDVDRVPHHLPEALWRQRQALPASQPRRSRARNHFLLREPSGRQVLERLLHQRRAIGIVNETLVGSLRSIQVSERRREGPSSEFQRRTHARARPVRTHIVVELRECSQHAFHQLAG